MRIRIYRSLTSLSYIRWWWWCRVVAKTISMTFVRHLEFYEFKMAYIFLSRGWPSLSCEHQYAEMLKRRAVCLVLCILLGDIAGKRLRLLRSMLPFCGLSVCHVRALCSKDIRSRKTAPYLSQILPQHLLIWASDTFDSKLWPNGYRDSTVVTMESL